MDDRNVLDTRNVSEVSNVSKNSGTSKTEGTMQEGGERTEASVSANERMATKVNTRHRIFGRGIYGSKDVPIRLLDGFIAGCILIIVSMIIYFAIHGGYTVSFDTRGGNEIPSQKLRYGKLVEEPEEPIRQGYEFAGWYYENDGEKLWNFAAGQVGGDMTLLARWEPAMVTVKFDSDGGELLETEVSKQVLYQGEYGELPLPTKEGFRFAGWIYSGEMITPEHKVMMPGEHVLTAVWESDTP
ncbi:MAG: InlB B-repeat-containing protein [Lachnospiraceae bacterium]|nr:InlB B-repeat-containing protein [Lachnospiraceae bacterium]